MGVLRPGRAAGVALAVLSLAGAPPLAGFFGEFAVAAALAQSGHFALLALGILGSVLSLAAAAATLRLIYVHSPLEEARRGSALPALARLSSAGAGAFFGVIPVSGLFSRHTPGLADRGAEALAAR